jgi:TfoX/Sxy family transcriptional regulator of competence genes
MAYNEQLADRIIHVLKERNIHFDEKKMFGGIAFMVDEKMCLGIIKENLMLRVDPNIQDELILHEGCKPMDFTHKPMKGYLFVEPLAIDMDDDLANWIQYALDFNPIAKKSKKA